jgi:uncharacterized delta-60 repeat protein
MKALWGIVASLCLSDFGVIAQFVRVDTTFTPRISGPVAFVREQPDQRILIGGSFTNVNGRERRGLARLNADGSLDESFDVQWLGPQPSIWSLEVVGTNIYAQTYGEWLVVPCYWGHATTPNQALRLSMDGTVERRYVLGARFVADTRKRLIWGGTQWNCRYGPATVGYYEADDTNHCAHVMATLDCLGKFYNSRDSGVYAILRQIVDGADKILIGGYFGQVNSNRVFAFARLNDDGTLDDSFQNGSDEVISAIAVDSQNRIFTGSWKGKVHRRSFNGNLDPTFTFIPDDSNKGVSQLIPDENGGVFLMSQSSWGRPTTLKHVDATGTLDTNFLVQTLPSSWPNFIEPPPPPLPYWTPESIAAVAVQLNGHILIGGGFTNVNCAEQAYLARLIPSGEPDPSSCFVPPPLPPKPPPHLDITRIRGAKVVCCWPTNYPEYELQGTRHLRTVRPERTKWEIVPNIPATNESFVCVTNKVARYGRSYRLVPKPASTE